MKAAPFDGTRTGSNAPSTAHKFTVGDSTFIVDHGSNDELKLYERKVVRVSSKQVWVEGVPRGRIIHRLHHDGSCWIPIVFPTAAAALESYIAQCLTERERAQRRLERTSKLIAEASTLLHRGRQEAAKKIENTDDDTKWGELLCRDCGSPEKAMCHDPAHGHAFNPKPYRNKISCVGITVWTGRDPKGCGGGHRYSVGPIPKEPDVNKSPRCPNCGGLVIEIGGPL